MSSSQTTNQTLRGVRALLQVSAAGRRRGLGRYDVALTSALQALGASVTELQASSAGGRLAEVLALPTREVRLLRRDYDVFHVTTPYEAPLWGPRPVIASVHDIIPLDVASHRKTGLKADLFYRLAARADVLLTLSAYTSQRLVERLGVDPDRIVLAALPPAPCFVPVGVSPSGRPQALAGKRYVAALLDRATADPRKRGEWLTWLGQRLSTVGVDLAVAGEGTETMPCVIGLGRIDDTTWASVLRHAELFAYTSAYEGQGLPPLEAIACGTPVVAFANTSLVEVVGAAGLLLSEPPSDAHPAVGPHTPDDAGAALIADACVALTEDGAELGRLRAACAGQAAAFSVAGFEAGVAEAYRRARSS